jgi:hypothetical protein
MGMAQDGEGQVPGTVTALRRPPVRQSVLVRSELGGGGEHSVPGHANILSTSTDISGEVKRRVLPGLKAEISMPRS